MMLRLLERVGELKDDPKYAGMLPWSRLHGFHHLMSRFSCHEGIYMHLTKDFVSVQYTNA